MKTRRYLLLIPVVLVAAGCATALPQIDYYEVETDALRKVQGMSVLDDAVLAGGNYRELGEIQGQYCDRIQAYAGSPEQTAIDQLRLRAAIEGADHIGTPACETRTTWDLTNNCFSTVTCTATAFTQVEQ